MNLAIHGIEANLGAAARRHLPPRPAPRPQGRLRPRQSAVQRLRLVRPAAPRRQALGLRRPARRQRQLRLDPALHPPPRLPQRPRRRRGRVRHGQRLALQQHRRRGRHPPQDRRGRPRRLHRRHARAALLHHRHPRLPLVPHPRQDRQEHPQRHAEPPRRPQGRNALHRRPQTRHAADPRRSASSPACEDAECVPTARATRSPPVRHRPHRLRLPQWRGEPTPDWWNEERPRRVGLHRRRPASAKPATIDEIAKHGHVLTPGRYVGAEDIEDDAEPFAEKYPRLVAELEECFGGGGAVDGRSCASDSERSAMATDWMPACDTVETA